MKAFLEELRTQHIYRIAAGGARILTASWDKTAKLWDAISGKLIATFAHQGAINTAAFSPDGARILTASADKTAKLWNAVSGKLIASFPHEVPQSMRRAMAHFVPTA